MNFTNHTNIPLSIAAWLADDTYDYNPDPFTISATHLLKPLKAIILGKVIQMEPEADLATFIASKMGTAVHDGIEDTWRNRAGKALNRLGYPEKVWKNIVINPVPSARNQGDNIDIYLEVRGEKELSNGWKISGKFDFVGEGQLEDFKTKKVWAWVFATQDDYFEFIMQGSIYRWLHPTIITQDTMAIDYLFTDWKAKDAQNSKDYPQAQIQQKKFQLKSPADTEKWLLDRTNAIAKYSTLPQSKMPDCTPAELWQKDAVYKYYKNPLKLAKATKNFDSLADANTRLAQEGVGIVKTFPGEVKRCNWCSASSICQQRDLLELAGLLKP